MCIIFAVYNKKGYFFKNEYIDKYINNAKCLSCKDHKHIIINNRLLLFGPNNMKPIVNNGIALIALTKITNYKELREIINNKLPKYRFKTDNESEIIIALYILYGSAFIHKIEGSYSFILYDAKKNILYVARDHSRDILLFYKENTNSYIFSSEVIDLDEETNIFDPGTVFINNTFYNFHK